MQKLAQQQENQTILEGDILEGNYWPEPARVVAIKRLGNFMMQFYSH